MPWHPRGEPTWPDWKTAKPGTRVEHVRSGRRGTLVRAKAGRGGNSYAVINWDPSPTLKLVSTSRVVAPAFDLRPLSK